MAKYTKIKEAILSDISAGRLRSGDQLPIREELIKKYGVTRATLSKSLSELISEGWLTARRNKGTFITDGPEDLNVAFVTNAPLDNTAFVGWQHSHLVESLNYIISSSSDNRFDFLTRDHIEKRLELLSSYDAVIWLMPNSETLEKLEPYMHKVLVVNRYADDINFVSTNHRQAMRNLTESFIKKFRGELELVYLDIPGDDFVLQERREGFMEVCEKYQKFYRFVNLSGSFEANVASLTRLKVTPATTALLSPTCWLAGAVFRMAFKKQLEIGKDLYYADFDNADSLIRAGVRHPSVLQNYKLMGEEILGAIKKLRNNPVQKYIPQHIINLNEN